MLIRQQMEFGGNDNLLRGNSQNAGRDLLGRCGDVESDMNDAGENRGDIEA